MTPGAGATGLRRHRALVLVALLAGAVFITYLIVVAERVQRTASVDEARPAGAIVVFGAAEYSGRPSPVFRARLDHGFDLFERGLAPLVITTGGAARDPYYSEGQVGRDYLIARGIPDLNLIAETQSGDTAQSAVRVARIMRANGIRSCVAVSDAYHLYRVRQVLAAQGVAAYVSPRAASIPRTWWGRWAASLREAVSYLLWRLHLT
jgi:uncharacterized SAM-binding protein YcdF (DUF218 family)